MDEIVVLRFERRSFYVIPEKVKIDRKVEEDRLQRIPPAKVHPVNMKRGKN
jgi:hypothetical protein